MLARITTASVKKCTGKSWDEWVHLLDRAKADRFERPRLVAFLGKKHRLGPWWQQMVASGYEIAIGRKVEGRNAKGEYSLTATKTFPVSREELWDFLVSERGFRTWLGSWAGLELAKGESFETTEGHVGEVRSFFAPDRLRISWRDPEWKKPTYVQIYCIPRPGRKCIAAFTHEKIPFVHLRDELRKRWKGRLEAIQAALK